MTGNAGTYADRKAAAQRAVVRKPAARRAGVRSTAVRSTRSGNRMLAAFAVLAGLFLLVASRVHVNASWSDDAWGYLLLPMGNPRKGDVVIFDPPESLRAQAPYLKSVVGVPGDTVSMDAAGEVSLNGEAVARAKPRALDGRTLVPIAPVTIPAGHYYLHADHADSHDSRYAEVGLVPGDRILGRAIALPDIPWLGLEGPAVQPKADGQETHP
ncbi:MAG: signal peptidase I [Rhodospirillales bacterium]|nr:signal peptidase I [Rhodospirillales bacterium]